LRDDERRGLRVRCGGRKLRHGQSGRGKQHDAKVCHDDLGPWECSGSKRIVSAVVVGWSINGQSLGRIVAGWNKRRHFIS
jgi:hypothetical protein